MKKFKLEKSKNSNAIKSIRFPEDVESKINEIIKKANYGLKKKEYSFNGFVVSACRYAIENYDENNTSNEKEKE